MTLQQRIIETIAPSFVKGLTERVAGLEGDLAQANRETSVYRDSLMTFGDVLKDQSYGLPTPRATIEMLQEQGFDQALLQQLIDQLGWDQIGALGAAGEDTYADARNALVRQAERLFRFSPLAQWSIWLWTGWGLGDRVTVTLDNTTAQEWWNEFAVAERNEPLISEDVIHELSDWLLVKGNRFVVFFTATIGGPNKGRTTARILDQDEMTPVCNPQDKTEAWFYKRTYSNGQAGAMASETLYYPDYRTLLGEGTLEKRWSTLQEKKIVRREDKRADLQTPGTAVSVLHIAHNRKDERSPWGWPITTAAGSWVRGHKQFSEARLGVAMAIAQFVRRTQVKGGSRGVASYLSQIQTTLSRNNFTDTNPPGAAGSWHAENEAATTKELPMRTGASDAKEDNNIFAWMAGLGMGLFPTSMGLDTSRWATAVEMDKAQAMLFERYQRFWSAQFRKIVRIVLMLGNQYGGQSFTDEQTKATISTDTFSLSDFPAVTESISNLVDSMLTPYVKDEIIPEETAAELLAVLWRTILQALSTGTPEELTAESFIREPEDVPEPLDTSDQAGGDEDDEDEEEPGMDEGSFIPTLTTALENLEQGYITVDHFAEFMMAEIGDVYVENKQA